MERGEVHQQLDIDREVLVNSFESLVVSAIANRALGETTVLRLLDLNGSDSLFGENTVHDLRKIEWGKTPIAQGLRTSLDFYPGETVNIRDKPITHYNFSQGIVEAVDDNGLVLNIGGWRKTVSPVFPTLLTDYEMDFYKSNRSKGGSRLGMTTTFANFEITRFMAVLGIAGERDDALIKKLKRYFKVSNSPHQ